MEALILAKSLSSALICWNNEYLPLLFWEWIWSATNCQM